MHSINMIQSHNKLPIANMYNMDVALSDQDQSVGYMSPI
jgi:hypothetical protein